MKRRLILSTALAWAALSACAESPARPQFPSSPASAYERIGSLMQVSVVDRTTGRELPIYRHRGEFWVAGRPGSRYAIRARNAAGERVMAVMSVDGVNIVRTDMEFVGSVPQIHSCQLFILSPSGSA